MVLNNHLVIKPRTDKTEALKDLAKEISNIFNHSEVIAPKAIVSIFSGLIQTGGLSWFNKFNHIKTKILLVISGKSRFKQFTFIRNVQSSSIPQNNVH